MSTPDTSDERRELIQQLYDHRTRRMARQRLVAAEAVDELLACLDARNESVVWAAVQSLGELRSEKAVPKLIELLERNVLVLDVAESLTEITGQDFGTDAARWRQWLGDPGHKFEPVPDPHECVRRAANYLGTETRKRRNVYELRLELPTGRTQRVLVFVGRADGDGNPLVVVYSECGPADARHYESVLRKNLRIPAGAFAIRDVGGTPMLVLVNTLLCASLTPRHLAKCIENIAARADLVEQSLTREDRL